MSTSAKLDAVRKKLDSYAKEAQVPSGIHQIITEMINLTLEVEKTTPLRRLAGVRCVECEKAASEHYCRTNSEYEMFTLVRSESCDAHMIDNSAAAQGDSGFHIECKRCRAKGFQKFGELPKWEDSK